MKNKLLSLVLILILPFHLYAQQKSEAADYATKALVKQYQLDTYFKRLEDRYRFYMQLYTPLDADTTSLIFGTTYSIAFQKKIETKMDLPYINGAKTTLGWMTEDRVVVVGVRYEY